MNALVRVGFLLWLICVGMSKAREPLQNQKIDEDEMAESLGDDFVFDVVARANEAVVANIDSTDLALLGVLAVIAAVLVFGVDKVRDLSPKYEFWALGFLLSSGVACLIGYGYGLWKTRDSIDPRAFLIDFGSDPEETTVNATVGAVKAYDQNVRDRAVKRFAIAAALILLFTGTALVVVAKQTQAVVSSKP